MHYKAVVLGSAVLLIAACQNSRVSRDGGSVAADSAMSLQSAPMPAPSLAVRGKEEGGRSASNAGEPQDDVTPSPQQVVAPSMVIRTGDASVQVDSLETAIALARALATRLGGYVANTSIQTGVNQIRSATIELKIPAPRFDEAMSGLAPIGKVEAVNVNAQDVGEEFVDMTARMENSKRLEERLVTLLANRTGKLEEVLAVERELARVRQEIERYEGRLRYLRTRVATSTLTLTMHEPTPIVATLPGRSPILEAFKDAWRNFIGFVAWFISSLGVLVPLGVIAAVAFIVLRRWFPALSQKPQPPREGGAKA